MSGFRRFALDENNRVVMVQPDVGLPISDSQSQLSPQQDTRSQPVSQEKPRPPVNLYAKFRASEDVQRSISEASSKTGVDEYYLARIASIESGLNPYAKAQTSTASGLFQFTKKTWKDSVKKYGKKHGITMQDSAFDPRANALMGAELLLDNKKIIESKTRRTAGATDLYMAHFLGVGSAARFINEMYKNPSAIASEKFTRAAKANQRIFFDGSRPRTLSEVYNLMKSKVLSMD